MKGKLVTRIFVLTILLGMLASATASGSHLKSSSPSSGPPQIQKHPQIQKSASFPRNNPDSLPLPLPNKAAPSPPESRSIPTVAEQKKPTPKPHTKLGWRFLLHGQTHAAMSAYRQALRHNPKSARAYLGLGITMRRIGKVNLAKKAFLKAVKLDPRLPSALVHLGYLYAEGHFGQADLATARRLFQQASQLGDPFASIALLDMKFHSKL